MATYTYATIPQLQAFVFEKETRSTLELRNGYSGAAIGIKLSHTHMLRFVWPLPEDAQAAQAHDRLQNAAVIPVSLGIDQNELHAAIAKAGLGHLLINLEAD